MAMAPPRLDPGGQGDRTADEAGPPDDGVPPLVYRPGVEPDADVGLLRQPQRRPVDSRHSIEEPQGEVGAIDHAVEDEEAAVPHVLPKAGRCFDASMTVFSTRVWKVRKNAGYCSSGNAPK